MNAQQIPIRNYVHNSYFTNPYTTLFSGYPSGENNIDLLSYIERTKAYVEEYKYNLSLAVSKFKLKGANENNIDESFFFNVLIEDGSLCAFNPPKLSENIVVQPYCATRWNYYAKPTEVNIIPYYENGVTLTELSLDSRQLAAEQFEIIYLNKTRIGFAESLAYEARMCSMLDICLYNNVLAKSLALLLRGNSDDLNDIKIFINKILNQNGIIAVDVQNRADINELLTSVDLNVEWLADKIHAAKMSLRSELHERLGITHAPYEKKERLIEAEIQTQNEAADLLSASTLQTINSCLERCNEKFKLTTPLSVEYINIGVNEDSGKNINIEETREYDTQE